MRLKIRIQSQEAEDYLTRLQPRIFGAVQSGFTDFMNRVANRVRQKLSGEVLRVRTGHLRQSIFNTVQRAGNKFIGKIGTNVKYAAIHEFGGVIQIPEIRPVKAQALRWFVGGKPVFAMRARAHTVTMPKRSFLQSSLDEMAPQAPAIILSYLEDALGQ